MLGLAGKTALVTGATSGIGKQTALLLAELGAKVMVAGRNKQAAESVCDEIISQGGKAAYVLGDVSSSAFAEQAVQATLDNFGHLHILANIAGAICRGNIEATSDDDWASMMTINVSSVFYMSRAAIEPMRDSGGGSIINLGSTVGMVGCSGLAAYCASKGAVVNLTRAMALDHAKDGIRVNSVNPGAVDTPMLVSGHSDQGAEQVREANRSSIPQGWLPKPIEVANTIAYLASDLSQHVTGTAIPVDGGYTAA